jgi:hypothetical protein
VIVHHSKIHFDKLFGGPEPELLSGGQRLGNAHRGTYQAEENHNL